MDSDEFEELEDPHEPWVVEHYDALEELYRVFQSAGRQLFGNAFFQLAHFGDFTAFVRKTTIF